MRYVKKLLTGAAVLLAAAVLNPATAGSKPAAATYENCTSAFNASSAAQTCRLIGVGTGGAVCHFAARCTRKTSTGDDRGDTTADVAQTQASNLQNCNGILKVGSC